MGSEHSKIAELAQSNWERAEEVGMAAYTNTSYLPSLFRDIVS